MGEEDYEYENLKKLNYIDCVEKEVTRFYGPLNVILTRLSVRDHFLRKIPIKKNTNLGIQPIGTHYSEQYYKNPREFRP